ncbi:MAG: hypothetical protein QOJ11_202 [Frankiales bacterium]|nr:hypothetical protein [Frankiales bacterium]
MIRRLLAVFAASIAVLGTSAGAALAQYPPTGSSGSVSATKVVLGTTVDFGGSGFAAGSKVTVSVNDAVYATLVAGASASSALGHSAAHFATAAYVRPAATTTVGAASAFSIRVTLNKLGLNILTGSGVDPAGNPRVVTAKVTVAPAVAAAGGNKGSNLPFTGSSVVVPGLIIGLTMMAGGFFLLTTVRSRRVGGVRS